MRDLQGAIRPGGGGGSFRHGDAERTRGSIRLELIQGSRRGGRRRGAAASAGDHHRPGLCSKETVWAVFGRSGCARSGIAGAGWGAANAATDGSGRFGGYPVWDDCWGPAAVRHRRENEGIRIRGLRHLRVQLPAAGSRPIPDRHGVRARTGAFPRVACLRYAGAKARTAGWYGTDAPEIDRWRLRVKRKEGFATPEQSTQR